MFNIRLDVYLHHTGESELLRRLDALSQRVEGVAESLEVIQQQGASMATALETLQAEVAEVAGRTASVIALVEGLSQFIRDNVSDQAALLAMAAELDTRGAAIDAAIAANPIPTPPNP